MKERIVNIIFWGLLLLICWTIYYGFATGCPNAGFGIYVYCGRS